jgi:hypothetical protein
MSLEITFTGQLAAEAGGNRADATHLPGLDAGRLDEALGAAERARAIAGRPLLPGHDGAWVQDRRAALHRVLVRTLELLVEVHLAAGHIYQGAADHHLGILAATAGRWEDSLGTSGPPWPPWPPWPPTSGSGRVPGGRSPSRPMRACSAAGTGTATGPGPPTWTRPPTPAPTGSAWRCQDGATPALGPRS